MYEILKDTGIIILVLFGCFTLIVKLASLLLSLIEGMNYGDEEWVEYQLSKQYRLSGSFVVRFLGGTLDFGTSVYERILKSIPVLVSLISSIVLLLVVYAVFSA